MTNVPAMDVANWFINRANVEKQQNFGEGISNMKLQKILYFTQAAYLAINHQPLFIEKIVAWQYGPVVEDVYTMFKSSRANAIKKPSSNVYEGFEHELNAFLEDVWLLFGKYSPGKLVEMTHSHDPWRTAYSNANNKSVKEIPVKSMENYYSNVFMKA